MAKVRSKNVTSKVTKTSKVLIAKKSAMKKKKRKVATQKKSKRTATKNVASKKTLKPSPKGLPEKIVEAFTAVLDTLTDAEQLHHKMDPGVSREPE